MAVSDQTAPRLKRKAASDRHDRAGHIDKAARKNKSRADSGDKQARKRAKVDSSDAPGEAKKRYKLVSAEATDGFKKKPKFDTGDAPVSTSDKGQCRESHESHAKQRQLAKERKAVKPLADELQRAKKIWERLRLKSHVPKEERQQLLEELYAIITGRVKDFVLKHDAVRAVQTAIKYSTMAQRKDIARELKGTYVILAESRYAKFLVAKLLVQTDKEVRDMIVPEFYGRVRHLINHAEASWILDDMYRAVATEEQKRQLLREWYGPEFALIKDAAATEGELADLLAAEPSRRASVMKHLFGMINGLVQKKMTAFTMLHDAMLQYFLNLKPGSDNFREFVDMVKGDDSDLLKNMVFTRSGARLVCLLLAYGDSKERRHLLQAFKATFKPMAGDQHAHIVILAAYDLIDDTVAVSKRIFPELIRTGPAQGKEPGNEAGDVIWLANNLYARTTVLYLLEGPTKSLFPSGLAGDLSLLQEVDEIRKSTSRKEAGTRRQELVDKLSPPLLSTLAQSAEELLQTSFGCQFVTDVMLYASGDKKTALQAVAAFAAGDPIQANESETYPPPRPHMANSPHAGKVLKALLEGGRYDREAGVVRKCESSLAFADMLYAVVREYVFQWATGPGAFVVLNLLNASDFSSRQELAETLRAHRAAIKTAAATETAKQKERRGMALVEEKEEEEEEEGKKKERKGAAKTKKTRARSYARAVGNLGAQLLLEKLQQL